MGFERHIPLILELFDEGKDMQEIMLTLYYAVTRDELYTPRMIEEILAEHGRQYQQRATRH